MGKGQNRRNNSGNMQNKEASLPKSGTKREKASTPSKKDEEGHKFIEKRQKEDSIEYDDHFSNKGNKVNNDKDDISTKLQDKFNEVAIKEGMKDSGQVTDDKKEELKEEFATEVQQVNAAMDVDDIDDDIDEESEDDLVDIWNKPVQYRKEEHERATKI